MLLSLKHDLFPVSSENIVLFFVYIIPFYIEFCRILNIFSHCVLRLNEQLSINILLNSHDMH